MHNSHLTVKDAILGILILSIIFGGFPTNAEILNHYSNNENSQIYYEYKNDIELKQKCIHKLNSIDESLVNNLTIDSGFYRAYIYPDYMKDIRNKQFYKNKLKIINEEISMSKDNFDYQVILKKRNITTLGDTDVIYVPDDYPTIQSAIENVSANNTIIVRDGAYVENIIVDKPLTICSENGYTNCTIKQQNVNTNIITITSDFVSIVGFNIVGNEEKQKSGISHSYVNYTTIVGNRLAKIFYCTRAKFSNNNIFCDNIIGGTSWHSESWGIWLKNCSNNIICNNSITDLEMYAVSIHLENSHDNFVSNNKLGGVSYCIGLVSASGNVILDNSIGSSFWEQIHIEYSYNNKIINNTFSKANYDGILLFSSENNTLGNNTFKKSGMFVYNSYNNFIENNIVNNKPLVFLEEKSNYVINENAGQIILVKCNNITISNQNLSKTVVGLELFKTDNSTISNSIFISDNYEGLYAVYSDNNQIINNTLEDHWDGMAFYNCDNLEISYNYIKPNFEAAILTKNSHYSHIHNNTIKGHDNNGLEIKGSDNVTICFNEIKGHKHGWTGFYIRNSDYNEIFNNFIHHNSYGIENIKCENSHIYHNEFSNNSLDARQEGGVGNLWDDGYPSGGNCWDDYTGLDKDSDGIGDTPYKISKNWDRYPLMEPYGNLRSNNNGPYFDFINNPIQFSGFACGGNPPYAWFWLFGDGNTSKEQNPIHTYPNVGKYTLSLMSIDEDCNMSNHISWVTIQETNDPPEKPLIDGPTEGNAGETYDFTFVSEDPDRNEVWYYVDWGDGNTEEWVGWYASGEIVTFSHKWSEQGTYIIKAKSRDGYNEESDWSSLEVTMPKNQYIQKFSVIKWLFEIFLYKLSFIRNFQNIIL